MEHSGYEIEINQTAVEVQQAATDQRDTLPPIEKLAGRFPRDATWSFASSSGASRRRTTSPGSGSKR